jgi:D123
LLLTQDLSRGHIVDFNPYAPRTDPLLFSYDELRDLAATSPEQPEFRVIDSPSHPATTRMAPTHQHNMLPIEAMQMSQGKSIDEFAQEWQTRMADAAK